MKIAWKKQQGGYTHEGVTLTPTAARELERELMKNMYTVQLAPIYYNGIADWGDCQSFRASSDAAAIRRVEKLIRKTGAARARLWAREAAKPVAQWSGGIRIGGH